MGIQQKRERIPRKIMNAKQSKEKNAFNTVTDLFTVIKI